MKLLIWVGSSRNDLREFPEPVQVTWAIPFAAIRFARYIPVRFARAVYVLHAFQKKSKTGRETPRRDIELIRRRLREAEQTGKAGER